MKALLASSAFIALLVAAPSAMAQDAPVCAYGSDSGVLNCNYYTFAQCYRSLPGVNNTETCTLNPRGGTIGLGGPSPVIVIEPGPPGPWNGPPPVR